MIKLEKLEKGEFFEDAFLVSYRYNKDYLNKMRSLKYKRYVPDKKAWLGNCDSYRLSKKYIEPLIDYMQDYYEKEVKGHAEVYRGFLQCR